MLKFEFPKQFHAKHNKLKLSNFVKKKKKVLLYHNT
jgi:hypothetical protein